jgi:hypothetical protein
VTLAPAHTGGSHRPSPPCVRCASTASIIFARIFARGFSSTRFQQRRTLSQRGLQNQERDAREGFVSAGSGQMRRRAAAAAPEREWRRRRTRGRRSDCRRGLSAVSGTRGRQAAPRLDQPSAVLAASARSGAAFEAASRRFRSMGGDGKRFRQIAARQPRR